MSKKRSWIFLRGLGRGVGHWGRFLQEFKARFPDDEIELIDLPGNGQRCAEVSPWRVPAYVSQVRGRSRFIQEGRRIHILAISLGGMVATQWMQDFPLEVEKAYLICTSAGNFSAPWERFMPPNVLKSLQLLKSSSPAEWEERILSLVTNSTERRAQELPAMAEFSKAHPVRVQNLVRQIAAASRYKFPSEAPGQIVLLGSLGDRLVAPLCTVKIGQQWRIHPVMHAWAGHDIPVDDPQWLVEHLL